MEAVARLRNYPTSPRKMRLVADLIRGREASDALIELEFNTKHSSTPLRKLLLSAISNWKQKNNQEGTEGLFVKRIFVDEARSLKRMLPAPQGRAYRIKKRSNHVTIVVDVKEGIPVANATPQTEQPATAPVPVKKTTKKKTEATK